LTLLLAIVQKLSYIGHRTLWGAGGRPITIQAFPLLPSSQKIDRNAPTEAEKIARRSFLAHFSRVHRKLTW
jgi:hypothetical protein